MWDTPQPFPEFPFFSKIHVQTFYWCGAQPWSFSNWWEDNWMADIYLPWNSTFYDTNIKVILVKKGKGKFPLNEWLRV